MTGERMLRFSWLLLALPVFFAPGAQARARDDAMANAYRCSAVGQPRQWLDCFYGAVQPARAALGLPPATSDQLRLASAPPSSPMTPDDARVRDAVLANALRCYAIADERQWLDCYYGAAQPMRARLGLKPAPQKAAPPALAMAAPASAQPLDRFPHGPAIPRGASRVVSPMAAYAFTKFHIFTVTLANGQVWRQLSGDTKYAHWTKPAASYTVTITHGAFHSFNLQVENLPDLFKVERIK
jgi:hypothetical protein